MIDAATRAFFANFPELDTADLLLQCRVATAHDIYDIFPVHMARSAIVAGHVPVGTVAEWELIGNITIATGQVLHFCCDFAELTTEPEDLPSQILEAGQATTSPLVGGSRYLLPALGCDELVCASPAWLQAVDGMQAMPEPPTMTAAWLTPQYSAAELLKLRRFGWQHPSSESPAPCQLVARLAWVQAPRTFALGQYSQHAMPWLCSFGLVAPGVEVEVTAWNRAAQEVYAELRRVPVGALLGIRHAKKSREADGVVHLTINASRAIDDARAAGYTDGRVRYLSYFLEQGIPASPVCPPLPVEWVAYTGLGAVEPCGRAQCIGVCGKVLSVSPLKFCGAHPQLERAAAGATLDSLALTPGYWFRWVMLQNAALDTVVLRCGSGMTLEVLQALMPGEYIGFTYCDVVKAGSDTGAASGASAVSLRTTWRSSCIAIAELTPLVMSAAQFAWPHAGLAAAAMADIVGCADEKYLPVETTASLAPPLPTCRFSGPQREAWARIGVRVKVTLPAHAVPLLRCAMADDAALTRAKTSMISGGMDEFQAQLAAAEYMACPGVLGPAIPGVRQALQHITAVHTPSVLLPPASLSSASGEMVQSTHVPTCSLATLAAQCAYRAWASARGAEQAISAHGLTLSSWEAAVSPDRPALRVAAHTLEQAVSGLALRACEELPIIITAKLRSLSLLGPKALSCLPIQDLVKWLAQFSSPGSKRPRRAASSPVADIAEESVDEDMDVPLTMWASVGTKSHSFDLVVDTCSPWTGCPGTPTVIQDAAQQFQDMCGGGPLVPNAVYNFGVVLRQAVESRELALQVVELVGVAQPVGT